MVWLDEIGAAQPRALALAARHTGYEVSIFLDWFEYLRKVAERAGVSIAEARVLYAEAATFARAMDFDAAYPKAVQAVSSARDTLKRNATVLKGEIDGIRDQISPLISSAQNEGIDVNWCLKPLAIASAMYNAEDYIASLDTHASLLNDISHYVASIRAGLPVGKLSGTYDIPPETTDIITIDYMHPEAGGWLQEQYGSSTVLSYVRSTVKEYAPEAEIVGYRVVPPRVIVFIRSPIAPVIAALIIAAIFALIVYWVTQMFNRRAEADVKIKETEKEIADIRDQFYNRAYDDYVNGRITKETFDSITGQYDSGLDKLAEQFQVSGWGVIDMLKWLIPAAIVLTVVGWFVGRK